MLSADFLFLQIIEKGIDKFKSNMLIEKHEEVDMAQEDDKNKKPSWLDLANLLINFGLFVVALLALILK